MRPGRIFKNLVELQSGTFTKNINKNTQVLIVGDSPSLLVIAHAKKLGIAMVSYDLLTISIRWEITRNVFLSMGECMGEGYHGDFDGEGRANSEDKQAMVQACVVDADRMEVEDVVGRAVSSTHYHDKSDRIEVENEPGQAVSLKIRHDRPRLIPKTAPEPNATPPPKSALRMTAPNIPINQTALNQTRDT